MQAPWLQSLKRLVEEKPLVILRFNEAEWHNLYDSRRGVHEFTVARAHGLLEGVRTPAPCLIVGTDVHDEFVGDKVLAKSLHFGLISSRSAITTLDSRIKVRRCVRIKPDSEAGLLQLVTARPHAKNLADRLHGEVPIVQLSPKLGSYVIERLASIAENHGAMRAVAESLSSPKRYRNAAALQEDAIHTALRAFGLAPDDQAASLELVEGRETALGRVNIMEDSVVEHDARHLPGFNLVESHLTGRAVFTKNDQRLEVFTANRRDLEHVFGVDLIYLDATRQNIVMLQYKMLEPQREDLETDWIYRPDAKLDDEIQRMRKFAARHTPGPHEYGLNPTVFYLKFVKRDGTIRGGGIITPIDHFEQLRQDPACKGPRGGLRISYDGLAGRYMRQAAFLDLLRSGYIGAHAETTQHLKTHWSTLCSQMTAPSWRLFRPALSCQMTMRPMVKTMNDGRINFDLPARRTIALRSGYRCAHPECDGRTTAGPARQPNKYEDTGQASHIFAASKQGPRGQGNLSHEELGSVTNGIWLCEKHADQVDTNDGKDYPPPVLLGWKAAHEFKIAREHGAMLHPFGWIEGLHIIDGPVFKPDQRITFANLNVIVGGNGVGKTTICECLWSLKDSSMLWRWGAYPKNTTRKYQDVKVAIDFRAPARHHLVLDIRGGRTRFTLDTQKFPFSPIGYEVVALRRERRYGGPSEPDQTFISQCLGMDEIEVQALAEHINESPGVFLKGAEWKDVQIEDDGPLIRNLYCKLPNGRTLSFRGISGGETGAVLIDLAIARAKLLAVHRPTLLIIETGGLSMGEKFLSRFLVVLAAPDTPFQSIIVTTELQDDELWGGWQVIRLKREPSLGSGGQFTEIIVGDVHRTPAKEGSG